MNDRRRTSTRCSSSSALRSLSATLWWSIQLQPRVTATRGAIRRRARPVSSVEALVLFSGVGDQLIEPRSRSEAREEPVVAGEVPVVDPAANLDRMLQPAQSLVRLADQRVGPGHQVRPVLVRLGHRPLRRAGGRQHGRPDEYWAYLMAG